MGKRGTLIGQEERSEASFGRRSNADAFVATHYTFLTNKTMLGAITVLLATNRNYVP